MTEIYTAPTNGHEIRSTDWGELDGSYRGDINCDKAIENAGYTVVNYEE